MKNRIQRTLFWFTEDEEDLQYLNQQFYSLAYLFNKLLNEVYEGHKISFVNFYFYSNKVYKRFPDLTMEKPYYMAGSLIYYGLLDYKEFFEYPEQVQTEKIWELAYKYFQESAEVMKNKDLLAASEYAYKKGKQIGYKTDVEVLKAELTLFGETFNASIWVITDSETMNANFVLSKGDEKVHETIISQTRKGIGLFYDIFKSIISVGNIIIVKAKQAVDGFPLSITLEKEDLKL